MATNETESALQLTALRIAVRQREQLHAQALSLRKQLEKLRHETQINEGFRTLLTAKIDEKRKGMLSTLNELDAIMVCLERNEIADAKELLASAIKTLGVKST